MKEPSLSGQHADILSISSVIVHGVSVQPCAITEAVPFRLRCFRQRCKLRGMAPTFAAGPRAVRNVLQRAVGEWSCLTLNCPTTSFMASSMYISDGFL